MEIMSAAPSARMFSITLTERRPPTRMTGTFTAALICLAAGAKCPVVVVPDFETAGRSGVVVGVDGSPVSEHALRFAAAEAHRVGEKLIAVSVWTPVEAPRNALVVIVITTAVFGVSVWQSSDRVIGTLQPGAPAGFHPRACAFDAALMERLRQGPLAGLQGLDPALRNLAAEDALDSTAQGR